MADGRCGRPVGSAPVEKRRAIHVDAHRSSCKAKRKIILANNTARERSRCTGSMIAQVLCMSIAVVFVEGMCRSGRNYYDFEGCNLK